jgi:hypothetical protein
MGFIDIGFPAMASPFPSVRREVIVLAAIAALMLFCPCARAAEPPKTDAPQPSSPGMIFSVDHLMPIRWGEFVRKPLDGPPGADYLALYFENRFVFGEGYSVPGYIHYFVLFRTREGHYILRTGPIPEKIPLWPETPKDCSDVEIPQSLADVICEIWVSELLETHYEKKMLMMMPHDSTFEFSAQGPGLGALDGAITDSTAGEKQPPQWLIHTGVMLLKFAADPHRDPKQMEAKLAATRDKLFDYLKLHGVQ